MHVVESRIERGARPVATPGRALPHVSLLFSDIAGFTELTERLGDVAAYEWVLVHHDVVRMAVARCGGEEVELRGDGFLLAFPDPEQALHCAIVIQRDLATAYADEALPIHVHMGLHEGPALRDGNGFFGRTVITAARIAEQAQPDEILMSSEFRARLNGGGAGFEFGPSTLVRLKGFKRAQRVLRVPWRGEFQLDRAQAL